MKNKLTLLLLLGVFLAPFLIAVLLNSQWIDWQAEPSRAHGELLQPVVPIGDFELVDATGTARTRADLAGRWQLVYATTADCDSACSEILVIMHNVRLAQDRRAGEAALLLITDRTLDPGLVAAATAQDQTWTLFDGESGRTLLQRFPGAATGGFYIVDPETNIIERFEPGADPTGIRKDLDRLLTWTVRE